MRKRSSVSLEKASRPPQPCPRVVIDLVSSDLARVRTSTSVLLTDALPTPPPALTATLPTSPPAADTLPADTPPPPAPRNTLRFDSISLLAHQVDHTARVLGALRRYGAAFDTSDTGTGKTYVACKVAERLGCEQIVVVCPNIVEKKWRVILGAAQMAGGGGAADRWMVFPYSLMNRTAKTHGFFCFSQVPRKELVINGKGKFVYREEGNEVTLKPGTRLTALVSRPRTLLILDETHKVKNGSTQISTAVLELIAHVRRMEGWVLHVSATPFDQLFQLPQYLRFVGVEPERARRLVTLATEEPLAEDAWDARECLVEIMRASTGRVYFQIDEALKSLCSAGSDIGSKWKAVRAWMYRMAGMLPFDLCTSMMLATQMEQPPKGTTPGTFVPRIGSHEVRCLMAYLTDNGPGGKQFINVHGSDVMLDAILWPLAIEDMEADIGLANDLVLEVLPRIRFRMVMPDLGFARHDMDLYLEDVDVSETVAALTYLPDYTAVNVDPVPAPLASPDCTHFVPESVALRWRSREWRLGEAEPIACWERIAAEARAAGKDARSAEAMALLCRAAAGERAGAATEGGRRAAAGSGAGNGEGDEADELVPQEKVNPRIRLESQKVGSLFNVVRQVMGDDAGSKAVVMFNFLKPLKEFVALCRGAGLPVIEVSGAMPPVRRADAVDRFNSSAEHRLLVCTIPVMNEGIDLHDTRGNEHRYSFIMACPSAIMTQQAKGRIFRAGVRSHAINCVVFGGYALGGELEEKLVTRIETKNATLQTVTRAVAVKSVAEFRTACGRVHAAVRDDHGTVATSSSSTASSSPSARMVLFPDSWRRVEFAARVWDKLKVLVDAGDGNYRSQEWNRAYQSFCSRTESHTRLDSSEMSELHLLEANLVAFEYTSRNGFLTRQGIWPVAVDPDSCLRGMTYERAMQWAAAKLVVAPQIQR
jgi:hypothetical protein